MVTTRQLYVYDIGNAMATNFDNFSVIKRHDTSLPLYLHVAHAVAHTGGGLVNLQAPERFASANDHIAHSARRLYAGKYNTPLNTVSKALENCLSETVLVLS